MIWIKEVKEKTFEDEGKWKKRGEKLHNCESSCSFWGCDIHWTCFVSSVISVWSQWSHPTQTIMPRPFLPLGLPLFLLLTTRVQWCMWTVGQSPILLWHRLRFVFFPSHTLSEGKVLHLATSHLWQLFTTEKHKRRLWYLRFCTVHSCMGSLKLTEGILALGCSLSLFFDWNH